MEQLTGMSRTLRLLFRRDPSRDRHEDRIHYEGYQFLWPDGQAVKTGVDAFCKHGQRLLGLGRYLKGAQERLVDLLCYPLPDLDAPLNRLPGHRVRRFSLHRQGRCGQMFFLDGTPTTIVLDLDRDEQALLDWIGLTDLADGETLWFDLAARPSEPSASWPETSAYGSRVLSQDTVR
jgi:hypothetical protein